MNNNPSPSNTKKIVIIIASIFFALFVLVLLVVLIREFSSNSKNDDDDKSEKNTEIYKDEALSISSDMDDISGTALLNSSEDNSRIQVSIFIYLMESLAINKKCFTCEGNPEYNHDCRSVDKYNYGAYLHSDDQNEDYLLTAQVYPMFCDTFKKAQTASEYVSDLSCWSESMQQDMTTDKFVMKIQTSLHSLDELEQYTTLDIYDTKDTTTRDSCVDGDIGTSSEGMDVTSAVENGSLSKSYQLKYE